jgi:outer membrane biogenesis lipoprotein LolB
VNSRRVPGFRGSGVLERRVRALLLVVTVGGAGCSVPGIVLPSGPGVPAPDAASAWAQASASCRAAKTYQGEFHVSGRVNGQRLHGTLQGAVTAADEIYLLMPAPIGAPVFVLQGTGEAATLLLPHDNRLVTGRADDIIEALTGLKQGPRQLLAILTGCVGQSSDMIAGLRYGAWLKIATNDATTYLEQRDRRWAVVAGEVSGLIVGYRTIEGNWPRALQVESAPGRAPVVALTIGLDQLGVNDLKAPVSAMALKIPTGAMPMTLEELRAIGPLREGR